MANEKPSTQTQPHGDAATRKKTETSVAEAGSSAEKKVTPKNALLGLQHVLVMYAGAVAVPLVIGGSLGAQALNEIIPQGMAQLPENELPQIVHQAGEKHIEALQANYAAVGVQAHCVSFIEDMAGAYEWADLVICRSGALTVAELAAAGVASILVPFPFAVDDHQTYNAKFLASAGGAVLLPQNEMTPESVSLLRNYSRGQLLQMAEKARALAKPDAAAEVARVCEETAK